MRVAPGGRDSRAQRRVAATDERDDSPLQRASLDQDVTVTAAAAEPDVGAESVDQPFVSPARVGPPEPDDVAEEQADRWALGHPPERSRGT